MIKNPMGLLLAAARCEKKKNVKNNLVDDQRLPIAT